MLLSYLRNRSNNELVDPVFGIVNFLLHESRIHNVIYTIDGQRSFCDISCNYNLEDNQLEFQTKLH